MQLDEILGQQADQVERVGAPRVAGELDPLPRRELAEHFALEALEPILEAARLGVAPRSVRAAERLDTDLELYQRTLEVERLLEIGRLDHGRRTSGLDGDAPRAQQPFHRLDEGWGGAHAQGPGSDVDL